jgi:hypothetical protein
MSFRAKRGIAVLCSGLPVRSIALDTQVEDGASMGFDAVTMDLNGRTVVPESEAEWAGWVSASATRNFMLRNTLIDWLDLHGEEAGFTRDNAVPGWNENTDFVGFIMAQGNAFEAAIVRHLESLRPLVRIGRGHIDSQSIEKAEETFAAMREGLPLIHQGVLRDAESRTYGAPDFLVRSDVLNELFPGTLGEAEMRITAPDVGADGWHYVIVDAKFTTLHLSAGGDLGNTGSAPAYKAQMVVYNRALGRLQGYAPPVVYLLGRGWQRGSGAKIERGFNSMDLLGPVTMDAALEARADEGANWLRRVRTKGAGWSVLPRPSIPELWPNMKETGDFPWHAAKSRIGKDLSDLTMLWQVSVEKRAAAHEEGVYSWRDPACTADVVGVTGKAQGPMLDMLLAVNREDGGSLVRPEHIAAERDAWYPTPALEFYVDFETVSDLADDFSTIPERGGQPLIFNIGCGHVEDGEWRFTSLVADRLTESAEAEIIDDWLAHMAAVTEHLLPSGEPPRVFHWSRAEISFLESSYNSAVNRHPEKSWPSPAWFDFLTSVARREPVVVRGSLGFGLKAVANALHSHGFIESSWVDSPLDGLGAMVAAWRCNEEAERAGTRLIDTELMREVAKYNEVDCKVMMEIVRYLREQH